MLKSRSGITTLIRLLRRPAARQPTDMPKNVASRTILVKKVRKTTVLPNQRMQASSRKRIAKLTRKRWSLDRLSRETLDATAGCGRALISNNVISTAARHETVSGPHTTPTSELTQITFSLQSLGLPDV